MFSTLTTFINRKWQDFKLISVQTWITFLAMLGSGLWRLEIMCSVLEPKDTFRSED